MTVVVHLAAYRAQRRADQLSTLMVNAFAAWNATVALSLGAMALPMAFGAKLLLDAAQSMNAANPTSWPR